MPVKSKRKTKKGQGSKTARPAIQPEPLTALHSNSRLAKHSQGILLCLYLFVALYLIPIFPHGGSANELTRWATAASIVEKHTFELSWILPLVGPIVDTAKVGEHTYSNKAPGPLLIAVPVYAATRIFTGPPNASNIRISWTFMRWVLSTAPLFLLGLYWAKKGASPRSLAVALFATPLFIYSVLLFSHVFTAVALYFSYRLLFPSNDRPGWKQFLLAGALAGIAILSEFPAAIPVAVILCGLLASKTFPWKAKIRVAGLFILGGLPFAALLLIYNKLVFGSFISLSYEHEAFAEWAEVASRGIFGISWPAPSNFWLLLFSPSRGLFFFAPVLLYAAYRLFDWSAEANLREKIRAAAVVVTIVVLCGHGAAHGGWAAGPRYLVMILPLLLEPLIEKRDLPASALFPFVTVLSLFLCVMPALTFPFSPPEYATPHDNFFGALLLSEKWFAPTAGALIGLGSNWIAMIPALLGIGAVIALVGVSAANRKAFYGGFAGAALVFTAYVLFPGLDQDSFLKARRASIAERFFVPADRLQKISDAARAEQNASEVRAITSMQSAAADARSYAPDDWPYRKNAPLIPGPSLQLKEIAALQEKGNIQTALARAKTAQNEFPFLQCSYGRTVAVLLYQSGRKTEAMSELEQLRTQAALPGADTDCAHTLFLLGSLYQEQGRVQEAAAVFREYLQTSNGLDDKQTLTARQAAMALLKRM